MQKLKLTKIFILFTLFANFSVIAEETKPTPRLGEVISKISAPQAYTFLSGEMSNQDLVVHTSQDLALDGKGLTLIFDMTGQLKKKVEFFTNLTLKHDTFLAPPYP